MALKSGNDLRLFGGVKNVLDDQGPFVPRTGDNYERGIGNFDSKFGGVFAVDLATGDRVTLSR